jgi:predicted RNA-binding Zn-ribbon protein involved in translation (DUF1610 family)
MSDSIMSGQARILPCPKCGQMIYSDSTQCRFCSAPIDKQSAGVAAHVQEQVNDACNQAKWIRNMAGAMWVFLVVSFILTVGTFGVLACFFLIPASLVYWQIKFGSLKTIDPDYQKAKRDRLVALGLWLPAGLLKLLTLLFA